MDYGALTLKQLRYFLALSETRNFHRAAERCSISQPSLTVQMQNLESILGMRLLERSRGSVFVTPAGREIAEHARAVLDKVQVLGDAASNAQQSMSATIRLGTKSTLGPYLLPKVAAKLHKEYPELKLYIRESDPREMEGELARGVHDIIVAQLPVIGASFKSTILFKEPLYLALAADHPLANKDQLEAKDIAGENMLSLNPRYHLHDQIEELCRDFGANLLRDYEGTSLDALRQMVAMGMGVTFLPALYVQSEIRSGDDIVVKKLKGKNIDRSIGVVWRKGAGQTRAYEIIANTIRNVIAL